MLRLKEGKMYKLRDGCFAKISYLTDLSAVYPVVGNIYQRIDSHAPNLTNMSWQLNGRHIHDDEDNRFDIVESLDEKENDLSKQEDTMDILIGLIRRAKVISRNFIPDWENDDQVKYYLDMEHWDQVVVNTAYVYPLGCNVYFETEEDAEEFLESMSEDEKKAWFQGF